MLSGVTFTEEYSNFHTQFCYQNQEFIYIMNSCQNLPTSGLNVYKSLTNQYQLLNHLTTVCNLVTRLLLFYNLVTTLFNATRLLQHCHLCIYIFKLSPTITYKNFHEYILWVFYWDVFYELCVTEINNTCIPVCSNCQRNSIPVVISVRINNNKW